MKLNGRTNEKYLQNMIFSKDILYIRVFRNKIEVRNVRTSQEVSYNVTTTFSNSRMLVADFETFEQQMRSAIKGVQKQGFLTRSSKMIFQPLDESVFEYSQVEKRAFRDSCEHAGAAELYMYFGRDKLSDQAITDGMASQFER
jgi:hypothetical protein